MFRLNAIAFVLMLSAHICCAQLSSPESSARKNLDKGRWQKAQALLVKALARERVNAGAHYLLARYFFAPSNPDFQIDSAYSHLSTSLEFFQLTGAKSRDRLERMGIDSARIILLREQIDSAAFSRAKKINTEEAFLSFLRNFPFASQQQEAILLRDEAAYLDAMKANSHEAFLGFLTKYPDANRSSEARSQYDRLLFESMTHEKTLAAYEQFLSEHPTTPYRREVEKNVFEISTATGRPSDFYRFVGKYPDSFYAARARNLLFHLTDDEESSPLRRVTMNDSLFRVSRLGEGILVPFLKDGRFGFMNAFGNTVMEPAVYELPESYRCGGIEDSFLVFDGKVTARNGVVISADSVSDAEDIGAGFLKVISKNCMRVIHRSKFQVGGCVDDAKIVAGKYVALKTSGKWNLHTLTGKPIAAAVWDEVFSHNEVIISRADGKFRMMDAQNPGVSVNQQRLVASEPYDEIKVLPSGHLWLRSGNHESIMNDSMQFLISPAVMKLRPAFFGYVGQAENNTTLFMKSGMRTGTYRAVELHEPWVVARQDSSAMILHKTEPVTATPYDSVFFIGPFAVGVRRDTVQVHFSPFFSRVFPARQELLFLPGKDSSAFLLVTDERRKTVFDEKGTNLFTGDFDKVQYAGENLFVIERKERKGLVNKEGKIVLPIEYDAVGSVNRHAASLLKNMKFGAYNARLRKLIKPQYERNINVYDDNRLIVFKTGKLGFVDWDNKVINKPEFDEVSVWNDSCSLVRVNNHWLIVRVRDARVMESAILSIRYIVESTEERLAIIKKENGFGVISNKRGTIIPATFTYLVNVGTPEQPVYFTEKHVEEASIFVVIYYDGSGKMLSRHVYEEADYDKIFCPDN